MREQKDLFSEKISAGSRTYFFDVKESEKGVKYLVISESRYESGTYKHKRVMVFQEHLKAFWEGLGKAMEFLCTQAEKEQSSSEVTDKEGHEE